MNTIFSKTKDGIIKGCVKFNPLFSVYQVVIDGSTFGEYTEEAPALEELENSFTSESRINPDVILYSCDYAPLSNQLKAITGNNLNPTDWEELDGIALLQHRKTGLIVQNFGLGYVKHLYSLD